MHAPSPYSETSGPDPARERLLRVWGLLCNANIS